MLRHLLTKIATGVILKKLVKAGHYLQAVFIPKTLLVKSKWQWQCSESGFRKKIQSETMIGKVKLPLRRHYNAMTFMDFSKKKVYAMGLQRESELSRHGTDWDLIRRLRKAYDESVSQYIAEESLICSDKSTVYFDIADFIQVQTTMKSTKETTKTALPWIHMAISNAKCSLFTFYQKAK